ncbi:MAG TPA: hypothetical protein VIE16_04965 [Phenylobacterium sp.]|jgi:hypothetical protein
MSELHDLAADERSILRSALNGPVFDRDPLVMAICSRLCAHRLMQRAGSAALVNGWRGSPHAFVLTREGWSLLKAERARPPVRQAS